MRSTQFEEPGHSSDSHIRIKLSKASAGAETKRSNTPRKTSAKQSLK